MHTRTHEVNFLCVVGGTVCLCHDVRCGVAMVSTERQAAVGRATLSDGLSIIHVMAFFVFWLAVDKALTYPYIHPPSMHLQGSRVGCLFIDNRSVYLTSASVCVHE